MNRKNQSSGSSSLLSSVFQKVTSNKRTSITTASAFLFAGAAVGVAGVSANNQAPAVMTQSFRSSASQSDQSPAAPSTQLASNESSSDAATGDATNTSSSSIHLNVNGQDIAIPTNGTTEQTMTNQNGTQQTSVSATGDAVNSHSSSISISVNSSSSSTSSNSVSGSGSSGMMNGTPVR